MPFPAPATVKVPEDSVALPTAVGDPMSRFAQGAGTCAAADFEK
jgi:hypothetical protein